MCRNSAVLLILAACISASMSVACGQKSGGKTGVNPGKANVTENTRHIQEPRAVAPPVKGIGARVVVDTSASMQGFAQQRSVALETLHRSIDQSLSRFHSNSPEERCSLGEALDCSRQIDYSMLRQAGFYDARQSRLDLALIRPRLPEGANPASPVPKDNLDPFDVTVIVTDGMQSGSTAENVVTPDVPTAVDVACAKGADPFCVGALLGARAREGYGIWLVALRLPFKGTHFAERALDNSHWERIKDSIENHNRIPEWVDHPFKVSGFRTDSKGVSSYQFHGAKPLLIFVLSRDVDKGRRVAAGLVESLKAEQIAVPDANSVMYFELAPLGKGVARLLSVKRLNGPDATKVVPGQLPGSDGKFQLPVVCRDDGKADIDVYYNVAHEGPPYPPFVKETVFLNRVVPVLDDAALKPLSRSGESTFRTSINCIRMKPGNSVAAFDLVIRRTMDSGKMGGAWWDDWSAANSFESPDKVFGLTVLVQSVLRPVVSRREVHETLRLEFTRE